MYQLNDMDNSELLEHLFERMEEASLTREPVVLWELKYKKIIIKAE